MHAHEDILTLIIHCKVSTAKSIDFRSKLWLEHHVRVLSKEPSVRTVIMRSFSVERASLKHNVLGYFIDFYIRKHKLAIEIDEKVHTDKPKNKEKESEEKLEKELGRWLISLNLIKITYIKINKICNHTS